MSDSNKPVAIRVDYAVDSLNLPKYAAHAMLFWEGPGVARTIIPGDRLTVPGGGESGLQATYSWTADGQPKSVSRVDRNIDFAWTSSDVVVADDTKIKDELLSRALEDQTSDEFLDSLIVNGKARLHSWTIDPYFSSQNLTSSQRQVFLKILLERRELLDAYPPFRIVNVYRAYRMGATEIALDVFGQWAKQNANYECELPPSIRDLGFDFGNRKTYHLMAMSVVLEMPSHVRRLQNEFLEMSDGSCSLPVAYTLGYSYLMQDKLDEWIALLEAKLAQNTLTGDRRTNWLIARAHADEIRLGTHDPFMLVVDRPLDGRDHLDLAYLTAEDPDVKLRITREIVGRLAAATQFDMASSMLDKAAGTASAGRASDIAAWRESIVKLQGEYKEAEANSAANVKKSYIESLQRRRDKAAADGNTKAVSRYNAMIKEAQSK